MPAVVVSSPAVLAAGIGLVLIGVIVAVGSRRLGPVAPWLSIALLAIGLATVAAWATG